MYQIVFVRHGESQWNQENRFTGWVDVPLSTKGLDEAKKAGQHLKNAKFEFDQVYCSVLKRAVKTLWIALEEMDQMWLPVEYSWRLNERHYGELQGLNKSETAAKHGEEQVLIWRRSYSTPPPLMDYDSKSHPRFDRRYLNFDPTLLPRGESLKDTVARVLPMWNDRLVPDLKNGKEVLVVAHGNSLRALIQHIEGLSEEEIMAVNLPTGIPLIYHLDENLQFLKKEFLGDPDEVKKAIESVANQGKAKK